jgi:hypothetical protein
MDIEEVGLVTGPIFSFVDKSGYESMSPITGMQRCCCVNLATIVACYAQMSSYTLIVSGSVFSSPLFLPHIVMIWKNHVL